MKILYVVHQFFPECFSGTEQYCLAVTREALRRGHDARVLSLDPNLGKDREALRVVRRDYDGIHVDRMQHWWGLLPNDTLRDYHNPLVGEMFRRVLREFQPDVVHVFHVRNLGADFLQIAKDEGCRLVVHLMDFWFLCPEFTLRRTDGTLCEGPPDGGLGCVSCHVPRLGEVWQDPKSATIARELALEGSPPAMHWSTVDRFTALMQRPEKLRKALGLADAVIAPSLFLRDMFVKNGFDASSIEVMAYGLQPDRVERREVTRPRDPLRVTFGGVLSPWKGP
ncbi:MAG: glycosyltransferase, partial [Planctomycetota bacterium]